MASGPWSQMADLFSHRCMGKRLLRVSSYGNPDGGKLVRFGHNLQPFP